MPNPTTLAMEEEDKQNQLDFEEISFENTQRIVDAFQLTSADLPGRGVEKTHLEGFGIGKSYVGSNVSDIETDLRNKVAQLEAQAKTRQLTVDRLERDLAKVSKENTLNAQDLYIATAVAEYRTRQAESQDQINHDLSKALAYIGAANVDMEASRDRLLKSNCEMTEELRQLKKIARAARAFSKSFDSEGSTDEAVEATAIADCELEQLLDEGGY